MAICFLIVFGQLSGLAQQMVQEDNQWNYEGFNLAPNPYFYSIRIGEDSVISNVSWHKVYYAEDTLSSSWEFIDQLIRQDSQKVYLKKANAAEYLLYDFGLVVGDSIRVPLFSSECVLIVDAIDSVQLNDGSDRKRMVMRTEFDVFQTWIEGIGSVMGGGLITHPQVCGTDYFENLLCFYESNSLQYPQNPSSCFTTNATPLFLEAHVQVYPNPVREHLIIESEGLILKSYSLSHLTGIRIKSAFISDMRTDVNLSDMPDGVYLLQTEAIDGRRFSQKIMKL
ncbi:MAG: T9SS type A sorting domain-containing protein [Bacteroidota bacterium]